MRVVDPQSALLTNAEVYDFLKHQSPRKPDKKIGAYEPVDLKGYREIRQDVLTFAETTTPQLLNGPRPEKYMKQVVDQLRKYDLTKIEVYTIINLGLGLPRPPAATNGEAEEQENEEDQDGAEGTTEIAAHIQMPAEEANGESEAEANGEPNDDISGIEALGLIIDSLEERFPEESREQKMTEILMILRDCISSSAAEQQTADPSKS